MLRSEIYEFEAWMATWDLGDAMIQRSPTDACEFIPVENHPDKPERDGYKFKKVKIRIEEPSET